MAEFDADTFNFDEPAAKDHGLLAAHLGCLKAGETVDAPLYDFKTHRRRAETVQRQPAPVILVEGLHLLASSDIACTLDLAVFVEACEQTRFARRMARDVSERARTPASVTLQFNTIVQPMHERHVEPQRVHADIVIENMGKPDFDALARPVIDAVEAQQNALDREVRRAAVRPSLTRSRPRPRRPVKAPVKKAPAAKAR